jgi:beta-N-acetylhexosaminidase
LIEGFTRLPPAKNFELQYLQNPKSATKALMDSAKIMFAEIRSCGIDMSLVPCLDIDWGNSEIIGDRSFSSDPELVCLLSKAYVKALKDEGMPVTGKHFPGHGYVSLDSHLSLPVDERSWEEIKKTDAKPYIELIKELDIIMTAHIIFPAIDALPVTFSKIWLQTILRQEMGFQGIIVSDCLTMIGASELYPDIVERFNAAHNAGCDWMFLCNSDSDVDELMDRESELMGLNSRVSL